MRSTTYRLRVRDDGNEGPDNKNEGMDHKNEGMDDKMKGMNDGMRRVERGTIVRTAVLAFALLNQALAVTGRSPLPFSEGEVGQAVSMALTAAASLWAWWRNNSFTQAAIKADERLKKPWR